MAVTKKATQKNTETEATLNFSEPQKQTSGLTRIIVHYDVGFNNHLYIRGNGANLNWNKGIRMRNIGPKEWLWETHEAFKTCEFKVLINDVQYEQGNNHTLTFQRNMEYTPRF